MIKVFLKHFIYEMCIDRIFDGIYKNFDICNKKLGDFKDGQYIPHLHINVADSPPIDLYKCKVVYNTDDKTVLYCTDTEIPLLICVKDDKVIKAISACEMAFHIADYKEFFESEQ